MDTAQFYNLISQHQNSITFCQEKIRNLEAEMEELADLKKKFQNYENDFYIVQDKRKQNLAINMSSLHHSKRYSTNILTGVESDLTESLTGSDNYRAQNRLGETIAITNSEIAKRQQNINQYYGEISQYKNKIDNLRTEIREIEKRKNYARSSGR